MNIAARSVASASRRQYFPPAAVGTGVIVLPTRLLPFSFCKSPLRFRLRIAYKLVHHVKENPRWGRHYEHFG